MMDHLTSRQLGALRTGDTEAEELLRLDDHLAVCPACRLRVAEQIADGTGPAIRLLRTDFSSPHLTESQLDDCAADRPLAADLMQHLELCEECRNDAAELRRFADAMYRPAAFGAIRHPFLFQSGEQPATD